MKHYLLKGIFATLLIFLLFTCGCGRVFSSGPTAGPTGNYYIDYDRFPGSIRNAVLFEFDNNSNHPEISSDLSKELYSNLQKNSMFGTVLVTKNNTTWDNYKLDPFKTYTQEQLSQIHEAMQCDAVLIGVITDYQPWPYMTMGMRLKLVDVRNGRLLWAYENSWDCSELNTKQRMLSYFKQNTNAGRSDLQNEIMAVSSINFIKFVAHETTSTIMSYNY